MLLMEMVHCLFSPLKYLYALRTAVELLYSIVLICVFFFTFRVAEHQFLPISSYDLVQPLIVALVDFRFDVNYEFFVCRRLQLLDVHIGGIEQIHLVAEIDVVESILEPVLDEMKAKGGDVDESFVANFTDGTEATRFGRWANWLLAGFSRKKIINFQI